MQRRTLCPVLVGRDQEVAALGAALDAARRGEGHAILVAGDAGIGKTRLIGELRRRAEADGVACLWGGCSETGLQLPYLPFVEAVRNHLRRQSGNAIDPDLAGLLGGEAGDGGDRTERKIRIFEAVTRLLEDAAAAQGAILGVEDLHWSDAGTRDLLDYLVRSLPGTRLLVIGTYRADEVGRGHPLLAQIRGWFQRGLADQLELAPLDQAEIGAMLEAILGSGEGGRAGALHARSEGNPFVLEEILKSGGSDALPASVSDTILRRVDALDPGHLEVLQAAAVLGDPVDAEVLRRLFDRGVAESLDECARQQLLTPAGEVYRWRHAITRDAVYQEMAAERRRRLHSDLADTYGRGGGDDVTVSRHLAAAGRWQEAVPRCRIAAAGAADVGAFADAARTLELCLPHVHQPERADVLEELAELLMQSGTPERGEAYAREALALREQAGGAGASAARHALAVCLWQQARWAEAVLLEERTLAELEALGPSPELVASLAHRASWNMLAEGDTAAAVAMVGRARRMAEEHGFEPDLYRADEGQVLATGGQIDEGLRILDGSWRSRLRGSGVRDSGRREARFMLHHAVALRNLMGRTAETLAILAEHPPSEPAEDAADFSLTVVQIEAIWAHGEVERARRIFDALDLSRVERNVAPWTQCLRCELLYSAGDVAGAAKLARTAMPPHWQATSQVRMAWEIHILLAAGDVDGALELAGRVERVRGYGTDFVLPLLSAAVETQLAAGDLAAAEGLAVWASTAGEGLPHRARIEGLMLLERGETEAAAERLRAAAVGFVGTGHRQDEWHTRRLLARALRAGGDRRTADAEVERVEQEIAAGGGVAPKTKPELSRREHEVALLVAQGLRNREIAARLFLSERTVENHVHRMLERTGLRSRAELAAQVARLSGELSRNPE